MEYISILRDTGFLGYREYKYSILLLSIKSHSRWTPHSISPEIRGEILSKAKKYPSLIRDISGIKETKIPSSFPFFFLDLTLYLDGLACQDYLYIIRSTRGISKHYRESND